MVPPQYRNCCGQEPSFCPTVSDHLFWMLSFLDRQLHSDCQAGSTQCVPVFISRCICLGFFLLYPTTNTRPVITDGGLWNQLALWLYSIDAADNLFPSIHCLVSWFCYLGIRGRKEIPVWYQRVSAVLAILVFVSTLLTKQHVLVDVAGGILLAELCFCIGRNTNLYKIYERFGSRIEKKILKSTEG